MQQSPAPPPGSRSQLGTILWRTRYSILSLALGCLIVLVPDQSTELLEALVEGGHSGLRGRLLAGYLALASGLWAATTWYSARRLLSFRFDGERDPVHRTRRCTEPMVTWLPRGLGTATYLGMAIALFLAAAGYPSSAHARRGLVLLGISWLAMGAVFFALVTFRRPALGWALRSLPGRAGAAGLQYSKRLREVPFGAETPGDLGRLSWAIILSSSFLLLALGVGFALEPVRWAPRVGALSILLLALSVWMPLATTVAFFSHRCGFHFSLIVVPAILFGSCWNDNHAIRRSGPALARTSFDDYFDCWQFPPGATAPLDGPVILVAAEGGGIRAAYWTASALARLQDVYPGFSRHVFAISSVSGGSVGAATFAAVVATNPSPAPGEHSKIVREVLSRDFLAPTVAMLLFPDFVQRLLPVPIGALDRARAMEASWEHALKRKASSTAFAEPLSSLWRSDVHYRVPTLLLNGTWVEGGKRFIVSPNFTREIFGDAVDGLASIGSDLPLSTATHLSARFPYISPLALVEGFGHVVDGGYFENSGAGTLLEVVDALSARSIPPLVLVIRYRDGSAPLRSASLAPGPSDSTVTSPALLEVLGPPVALMKTREAHASLAVEALERRLELLGGSVKLLELEDSAHPLPLGWVLSESARAYIDRFVDALDLDFPGSPGLPRRDVPTSAADSRLAVVPAKLRTAKPSVTARRTCPVRHLDSR